MSNPPANIVKSAARVLEIFELFDELRRPVSINEVAEGLGYPHSSTAALLKSLENLGYLEYDAADRKFFPSIRVSMLGQWVEHESLPVRAVQKLMQELLDATECTIIAAIRTGVHVQYIKVLQGTTAIRYHVRPGTRRLVHASTLGRVLLSQSPDPEVARLIEQSLMRDAETQITAKQVLAEVARIRRQGHGVYTGLVVPDGTMLGMPLSLDRRGRAAAIGLAAPKSWIGPRKQSFIELMQSALDRFQHPRAREA